MDVIVDTDIGDDIDDALALTLLLRSPELVLKGVVTNNRHEGERALVASKLLETAGRSDVPVYRGTPGGKGKLSHGEFIEDYRNAEVGSFEDFLLFLNGEMADSAHGPVYLSLGSLTNIAHVLGRFPQAAQRLKLVIMGGSMDKDYKGDDRPQAEWNIYSDVQAAGKVFGSGADIIMVGLDATWNLELPREKMDELTRFSSPLNGALSRLIPQWKAFYPERRLILYDPFTVGILIDESMARWEEVCLEVDGGGLTLKKEGASNVRAATGSDKERFLEFFVSRLLSDSI